MLLLLNVVSYNLKVSLLIYYSSIIKVTKSLRLK